MKNAKNILIVVLLGVCIWMYFFNSPPVQYRDPITITLPEKKGVVQKEIVTNVETLPVKIPQYSKEIVVDSLYKEMYEQAKDSIERLNLYLNAIQVKRYGPLDIVNNDTIIINAYAKTRGELLEYEVNWKVKGSTLSYEPEAIVRRPRLQASYGLGLMISNNRVSTPIEIGLTEGKYGIGIKATYDPLNGNTGGVITKTFTLIK